MRIKLLVTIETDYPPKGIIPLELAKAFAGQFHSSGDLYAAFAGQEHVACSQDAVVVEIDGFPIPEELQ